MRSYSSIYNLTSGPNYGDHLWLNTFYHYNKDGHLIEETDRYGTPITTYIRLAGEPLAQVNHDGAIYYYHNDHLGTPQLLSDVSGSTAWAADYLPFGDASISVESVTNNLRFAGQYYDWETGLHYNWHRYYDPETGRYVSADPIGLDGGLNLYAYVENDPVNFVDPEGLFVLPIMLTSGSQLSPGQNSECHLDMPCLSNCLSKYPGLAEALALTPLSLLNLKSLSQIANKRPGASIWTSIDKKWPSLPGANPNGGVKRPAGTTGRMKPVGTLGTAATAAGVFGTSYGATALLNCLGQCTSCDCPDDRT